MPPNVSIIIPLHNKGPYVVETLRSVVAQTMTDWEAVVVENHSSDDGPELVKEFAGREPRVKFIDGSAEARGPGAARNLGVARSGGEWLLFLDADDTIGPGHLSQLLDSAERHPGATVAAGGWREFQDGQGTVREMRPPGGGDLDAVRAHSVAAAPWAVHAAILRRPLFEKHPWDASLDRLLAEDICFWFRIVMDGEIAISASSEANYRQATPGCRTQRENVTLWHRGVALAVDRNLAFLEETGRRPSQAQMEVLVRGFSSLYCQAREAGCDAEMRDSLKRAEHWLEELRRRGGRQGLSIVARRMLGVPLFERTARSLKGWKLL